MTIQKKQFTKPKKIWYQKVWGLGKEKDFFLENLSLMLDVNLPITHALETLKNQCQDKRFKNIIGQIQEDMDNGLHLWQALEKSGIVPGYSLSLIKIGEESGKLSQNLNVVVAQQQKDAVLSSRIRTAMIYPALVTFLMLLIGSGIVWFVLPRLAAVFVNLRLKLPLPTKILINFGQFLQNYGWIAVPLFFAALILIFYIIFLAPRTKIIGQKILFSLPGVRTLIQEVEVSRFGYMLGTLLSSGLPIVEAVSFLEEVASFKTYKVFYIYLKQSLEEGNSFNKSFKNYKQLNRILPTHLQQIIISSEQSGQLEPTLIKIGKTFEEKSDNSTRNLSVILEPLLLVVVWFGVVGVALSIILPLYQLVGGLQTSFNSTPVVSQTVKKTISSEVKKISTTTLSSTVIKQSLKISNTVTGHLNVRDLPKTSSPVAFKVYAGEVYEYVNKQDQWFNIVTTSGKQGWVYGQYVQILP